MLEFDRLYREIEGDDAFGLDSLLADPSVGGLVKGVGEQRDSLGHMEEVLSTAPSQSGSGSGTDSNDNDMTDGTEDVIDADTHTQSDPLEDGAVWSHNMRLQMQRTPDILYQISENVKV